MQNRFLIELSQELPVASYYELLSICDDSGCFFEYGSDGFAVVSGETKSVEKAAFVKRISLIISEAAKLENLKDIALPKGTFFVRFTDSSNCHDSKMESRIGEMLHGQGRVNFKNPDYIIRAYHWHRWYICRETYSNDPKEFQKRRAPLRPFFSPVSIDPKYARFMINISATKEGDTVLDPFCGTGGILIEAHMLHREIIGIDQSLEMVTGSRLNLKFLGIRDYEIINSDFLTWHTDKKIDAIITDLPYGRSSPTFGNEIDQLYEGAFEAFSKILKKNKRCIVILSDPSLLKYSKNNFVTLAVIGKRVHKSLTRYFCCLYRK